MLSTLFTQQFFIKINKKQEQMLFQPRTEVYFCEVLKDQISNFKSEVQSSPAMVKPIYVLPHKKIMKCGQIWAQNT